MNDSLFLVVFTLIYVIAIVYFVILGCYMLALRDNQLSTHGELVAKHRLTRAMGVTMFVWALDLLLYLPTVLLNIEIDNPIYKYLFLVSLMLMTPLVFNVMFAVVQRQVNIQYWIIALGAPFLLLTIWQMLAPTSMTPVHTGAALSVASYLYLLIKFAGEYRFYIQRIRSEYSDTSRREIVWAWICFSGLTLQGIIFVGYMYVWSPILELLYGVFSLVNAGFLCFCASKQTTIDLDVVPETEPETMVVDQSEEKAFYADIEERLKTLCESKLLFLDPDITRETLCLRLAINRTYLSMYFRSRELTFYQYINTLRVEYAYRLMQENPHLSIRKVSEQSGFRSVTTFRKVFQEVMGCLPSEIKTSKTDDNLRG